LTGLVPAASTQKLLPPKIQEWLYGKPTVVLSWHIPLVLPWGIKPDYSLLQYAGAKLWLGQAILPGISLAWLF